jgi:hypothetical protein
MESKAGQGEGGEGMEGGEGGKYQGGDKADDEVKSHRLVDDEGIKLTSENGNDEGGKDGGDSLAWKFWEEAPEEVIVWVGRWLTCPDLASLRLVSRRLHRILQVNSIRILILSHVFVKRIYLF